MIMACTSSLRNLRAILFHLPTVSISALAVARHLLVELRNQVNVQDRRAAHDEAKQALEFDVDLCVAAVAVLAVRLVRAADELVQTQRARCKQLLRAVRNADLPAQVELAALGCVQQPDENIRELLGNIGGVVVDERLVQFRYFTVQERNVGREGAVTVEPPVRLVNASDFGLHVGQRALVLCHVFLLPVVVLLPSPDYHESRLPQTPPPLLALPPLPLLLKVAGPALHPALLLDQV